MASMTADRSELDKALDRGSHDQLPPPIPPGFMGERAPDMRSEESFEPSLNAGLIQESTWETKWLTIGVLYVLIVTGSVAAWLLWREPRRPLGTKVVATVLGIAGYIALFLFYSPPRG
jgi:ABC-type Fe3+ transport system permease subunit